MAKSQPRPAGTSTPVITSYSIHYTKLYDDPAPVGGLETGEDTEQGGLAAAVPAEQRGDPARRDVQRGRGEDASLAEALADAVGDEAVGHARNAGTRMAVRISRTSAVTNVV